MPFRKLGNENALVGSQAYNRVIKELKQLPDNIWLTKEFCDPSRFSGILIVDGKFIKVKGFKEKIPFVWALDYLTHDPIIGLLCRSEGKLSYQRIFQILLEFKYIPKVIVCDDRGVVKPALIGVFPDVEIQLCQNHYIENIRRTLKVRTDGTYQHFFNSLRLHVFSEPKNLQAVTEALRYMLDTYAKDHSLLQGIILDINQRKEELFRYFSIKDCPKDTNLIELYNSHLNARLTSIKGFKSFNAASIWLNAYLIRRRTKELTDCKGRFKKLNGHCSLELTIKKQAQWPDSLKNLGIKRINYFKNTD